jgi:hypothetical protein
VEHKRLERFFRIGVGDSTDATIRAALDVLLKDPAAHGVKPMALEKRSWEICSHDT